MTVVKDVVGVVVGLSMSYYLYRWAGGVFAPQILTGVPPMNPLSIQQEFDYQ